MTMSARHVLSSAHLSYHTEGSASPSPADVSSGVWRAAAVFGAAALGLLAVHGAVGDAAPDATELHRPVLAPTAKPAPPAGAPPTLPAKDGSTLRAVGEAALRVGRRDPPRAASRREHARRAGPAETPALPRWAQVPTAAVLGLFASVLAVAKARSLRLGGAHDAADLLEQGGSGRRQWALLAASGQNGNGPNNRQNPPPKLPGNGKLSDNEILGLLTSTTVLVALLYVIMFFNNDILDFQDKFSADFGFSVGDVTGAVLWSLAFWFTTPYQVLVLFLGRFEGDRPSDWLMARLSQAAGLDPDALDYEPPLFARAVALAATAASGAAVAGLFEATLGEATWSVSSGLGLCFLAAVFEAGRPKKLTVGEAKEREDNWQVFLRWADLKLQRRGNCHFSDISDAFRKYPPHGKFRTTDGLSDEKLKELIANWAPSARRTAAGFYKGLSLAPERADPGRGAAPGGAEKPETEPDVLEELLKS